MMRRAKLLLATFLATAGLFAAAPALAIDCSSASSLNTVQCGVNSVTSSNQNQSSGGNIDDTIRAVFQIITLIAGVLAVIMLIIGGLRFVTSGGSQDAVKNARNTILYAVIGLFIVVIAQLLVHFVFNNVDQTTCVDHKTSTGQKC